MKTEKCNYDQCLIGTGTIKTEWGVMEDSFITAAVNGSWMVVRVDDQFRFCPYCGAENPLAKAG